VALYNLVTHKQVIVENNNCFVLNAFTLVTHYGQVLYHNYNVSLFSRLEQFY